MLPDDQHACMNFGFVTYLGAALARCLLLTLFTKVLVCERLKSSVHAKITFFHLPLVLQQSGIPVGLCFLYQNQLLFPPNSTQKTYLQSKH